MGSISSMTRPPARATLTARLVESLRAAAVNDLLDARKGQRAGASDGWRLLEDLQTAAGRGRYVPSSTIVDLLDDLVRDRVAEVDVNAAGLRVWRITGTAA